MSLSTKSVIAVQAAKRLILYKDDPPEGGRIYFVVAQVGENRDQAEALTCEDGTRWQGSDREKVMEPVLALRPGMEATDFCGGSVARGPYADEIDRKLKALLVAMSGKIVAMLNADDIMMLSHGYSIARKLGIEIGFTHKGTERARRGGNRGNRGNRGNPYYFGVA